MIWFCISWFWFHHYCLKHFSMFCGLDFIAWVMLPWQHSRQCCGQNCCACTWGHGSLVKLVWVLAQQGQLWPVHRNEGKDKVKMPDEREENFLPHCDCGSEMGVPHTSEFPYWNRFQQPCFYAAMQWSNCLFKVMLILYDRNMKWSLKLFPWNFIERIKMYDHVFMISVDFINHGHLSVSVYLKHDIIFNCDSGMTCYT